MWTSYTIRGGIVARMSPLYPVAMAVRELVAAHSRAGRAPIPLFPCVLISSLGPTSSHTSCSAH